MKHKTIKQIDSKLAELVIKNKRKDISMPEIIEIMRATTSFHAVMGIICNYDCEMTISDLKNNSSLLSNIYINTYRLNVKIDSMEELIKIAC